MNSTVLFSRKARSGMLVLACILIFSMILTACGGTSGTGSKKSVLVLQANQSGDYTRNFNPFSGSVIGGTQGMIYETLLMYNRLDGSYKPWLATGFDISNNSTSITYHLRKNVQWSDGKPFTSDDVLFTLNLIRKYSGLDVNGIDTYIKDVVAPDTNTITVTLNKPFNPITWYLGGQVYIVPRHTWSTIKGDPSQFGDPNPIGTGPYVVKSFTPQLVTLSKNAKFWQPGLPKVDILKIPAYNDNSSTELALEKGQIDWTNLYIQNVQKSFADKDPHYHYWYPTSDIVFLYLNLAKFPFNQLAVRKAMSLGINRDQLAQVGESGYEPPATPTGLLPTNTKYLLPEYTNLKFTFDQSQAMSVLQEAGYKKGTDGIFADSKGRKLAFGLNVVSGYSDWINDAQLMARDLQSIGMKVTINTIEYNSYYDALQNGRYDTAMLWSNPGPTPYYLYDALLRSTNSAPVGQAAPSNYERWMDPQTDQLLQQYASTTDKGAQMQAIQGLEKVMVEQMPSIALTYEPYWYQYSTTRFTGWPDKDHPYAAPGTAEYPDIESVVLNLAPTNS